MMKVYVVQKFYDYEGATLLGVYSTQEKAEKVVRDGYKKRQACVHYDWDECDVQ